MAFRPESHQSPNFSINPGEREMESSLCHALTALLIIHNLTTYMGTCQATRPIPTKTNNYEYIQNSCNTTMYPQLCYKSLSSYADKIQANPELLANASLSVTLSATKSTSVAMKNLSKSLNLRPRETAAMHDCMEELRDSVEELQRSIEEMDHIGGSNFEFQISNIQTWVSAALTDDDTCLDGFAGSAMNGEAKTTVRRYIVKVAHLTSVALALINNYVIG